MNNYLGETKVDISKTEFALYGKQDWIMYYIKRYSGIDGSHHRKWLLDQIARIIHNTKINIKLAKWNNGESEYRINLDEPTKEYWDWVDEMKDGDDGKDTYSYDFGIAP